MSNLHSCEYPKTAGRNTTAPRQHTSSIPVGAQNKAQNLPIRSLKNPAAHGSLGNFLFRKGLETGGRGAWAAKKRGIRAWTRHGRAAGGPSRRQAGPKKETARGGGPARAGMERQSLRGSVRSSRRRKRSRSTRSRRR